MYNPNTWLLTSETDSYGRTTTYDYHDNGNVEKETYANGDVITYEYTESGDLSKQLRNGVEEVTYTYNEDGELINKVDSEAGLQYTYTDTTEVITNLARNCLAYGREVDETNSTDTKSIIYEEHYGTQFTKTTENNTKETSVTYDYNIIPDTTYEQTIDTYHGRVYSESVVNNSNTVLSSVYSYDNKGRVTRKTYNRINLGCQVGYDTKDRIAVMAYPWVQQNYFYDENDQLIRVNSNSEDGYTSEYTYDDRGNILSKKKYAYTENTTAAMTPTETTTFEYKETGWIDQLVKVNDDTLTYDANGNVLTYGDKVYTWERGRVLKSITEGENTYSFAYDEDGLRTRKTANGVTTYYNYVDGQIVSQKSSNENYPMIFEYNTDGQPVGFVYRNIHYYYLTNQMGDVIGVTDTSGNPIALYHYDEWGNLLSIETATEGNATQLAVAEANPLRYRGYYYDLETGYYYLQNRYYDPSICRFINADVPEFLGIGESITKWNLFSYCENKPVGTSDEIGLLPVHIIAGVAIGVAWAVIPRIISDVIRGRMSRISDYIADAVNGAISGLVTSVTGSSTLGTFLGTVIGETARYLMQNAPKLKLSNFKVIIVDFMVLLFKATVTTAFSVVGGMYLDGLTGKSFSRKQIKAFFKNTKYLKSAFGIGKGGKTARRIWFADSALSFVMNKILTAGSPK